MTHGSFWVTGPRPDGDGPGAPLYVAWERPDREPSAVPVVLVHGGGGQGLDYLTTPDGRPGWSTLLVAAGHPVYVVDRPGHGRSPYDTAVLGEPLPPWSAAQLRQVFLGGPGGPPLPPHTRWPGSPAGDDAVFAQFLASQGPMPADTARMHALERDRLVALLERVGPAVLLAHSAGGPGAFLAADARPDLVRGFVAVETFGPPFLGQPGSGIDLSWGLAAAPLGYDPPAADAAELRIQVVHDGPVPMALQEEPARRLPGLARVPIAIVTAAASPLRYLDGHLAAFLDQTGCTSTLLRLEDAGIDGNGHGMMLETNNAEVLAVITRWIDGLEGSSTDRRAAGTAATGGTPT